MQQLVLDLKKVKESDAYFSDKLLDFQPFDYQQKINWLANKILIRGGRRTGKDTLVVNRRIIPAMWKIPRFRVGVYAPGWEEAEIFMDIFNESVEDTPLAKSIIVDNKFDVRLSNKSRLLCRIASKLSTGKRGRGFSLLYFTEAEYIADVYYSAIRPSRLIGSAPEILASSPNGDDNFCSRAESSGLYDVYVWQTKQSPLVDPKELENEKKLCTDIEFRQEYLAERISGVGQAIHDKLIEKLHLDKNVKPLTKGEEGRIYVGGSDLGRRRDKSTVYILDITDFPNATIVYYKEFLIDKEDPRFWLKVIGHLEYLAGAFFLSKLMLDQTGIGDMPTIELRRKITEKSIPCVVEGFDFSYASKHKWEGLINQAILKFERFEIHGPFIRTLVVQLRSIRFNPKTKMYETRGPSPDHAMALFLAIRAATKAKHFFGTARNMAETAPLTTPENLDLKDKIKTGYALKASEMEPKIE